MVCLFCGSVAGLHGLALVFPVLADDAGDTDEHGDDDGEEGDVAQEGIALLHDGDEAHLRQQAAGKQEAQRQDEELGLVDSFSVFQALAHRLEKLKVKLGAVDTTARITTTQYTAVRMGEKYCWQIIRMGVPVITSGMKGSTMAPVTANRMVTSRPIITPEPMASRRSRS